MKGKNDIRNKIEITKTKVDRTLIFSVRFLITYNSENYLRRGDLIVDPSENLSDGLDLAKRLW